jgi:pyrimidine-nucleoside phosphorylase
VSSACQRLFGFGKVRIPMVSGRGLGHSGGTLDKLEAVPGFSPALNMKEALRLLEKNGNVMMGQTPDLAPADRLIYALRDATSTVESIPLIVSSIMSKKLAESLDGLVLDVKVGSGAFMETEARSRELAGVLMGVAKEQGLDVVTVLTRMDEPLGRMVGNHLEVEECADFLGGGPRERGLEEVVLELAAWMVHLAGRKKVAPGDAREECRKEIGKPEPMRIFRQMLEAQGGRMSEFEAQRASLRKSLKSYAFRAPAAGFVTRVEARALGVLAGTLGGGRAHKEDAVDALVGIECLRKEGDQVAAGETVAMVYYRNTGHESLIEPALRQAVQIGAAAPAARSWILGTLH